MLRGIACIVGLPCLQLDHATVAVGFGEEAGVPYFVVRNSWTAEWGEGGYIRIKAGEYPGSGHCGTTTYPVLDVISHRLGVTARA